MKTSLKANHDGNANASKQKGLMGKTMAVHVRYKSLYIS